MKIVYYDIDVVDENDRYVGMVGAALDGFTNGLVPGKFLEGVR